METTVKVQGMHCEHCSARIKKALTALGYETDVSLEKGEVTVKKDNIDLNEVKETILDLGFEI